MMNLLIEPGYPVALLSVVLAIAALLLQGYAYRARGRRLAQVAQDLQEAQRIAHIGTVRWDFVRDEVVWSDEYARLLGLEPGGRMTGTQFTGMLLPEYVDRVVSSEERALKVSAETGKPARREIVYRVQSRDGRIMDVSALSELKADRDGRPLYMISTIRDVTEELERQAELRKSESNLAGALRVADLSWMRKTLKDGKITWSDSLYALIGRDPAEGPVSLSTLICDEDLPAYRAALKKMRAAEPAQDPNHSRLSLRLARSNGEVIHARIELEVTHDADGEPDTLSGVIRDVTEDVKREAELHDAVAAAEHANASKSEFLAVISHELRTPMNGVLGMLGALNETQLDDAQREQVQIARNSANSLLVILNDILDASKIEAGRLQIEEESFELNSMVRSVIHLYAQRASEKRIVLDSRIDAGIPPWIRADSGRIRQILSNLVSNAIKFTDSGHVMLYVSALPQTGGEPLRLRFRVEDTGAGIPQEYHSRVFGRFEQLGASGNNRRMGTGLGLSISQSLAELMSGTMGFDSTEGEGSTFWLDLPVEPAENALERGPEEPAAESLDVPRMRILVAEDNSTNQLVARSMLERLGQNVDLVVNGAEAVEAVQKFDYDLVLMDVSMPVMDGPTATQRIRALPTDVSAIPILALTAHAGDDQIGFYMNAGFNEVLTKPILKHELERALDRWKQFALQKSGAEDGIELPSPGDEDVTTGSLGRARSAGDNDGGAPVAGRASEFCDAEALNEKLVEMDHDFGADTVKGILKATVSDLSRHISTLEAQQSAEGEARDDVLLYRSFHSLVGIASTLGCGKMTNHCRLLETLPDARADAPELVQSLLDQVRLMRDEVADLAEEKRNSKCA
ncbi:PAS domain-containing hybrid sensor histidine kinase/response regulator [Pseudooceanicola marinus]|uniref:hybrid sensor histidine kinase/response regulator n=1 Tax=Pseudooceanicola marinus TaxID=396013 RepID=UPI001CD2D6CF|nr:PAS domain-containing hybrid sensor histidine kinase/response regulator [Pseudooceanicola marinus]MCA1338211.1 response regulator [Pseudooceanicola marinus]